MLSYGTFGFMAEVTLSDRPKSVCNGCVIEHFNGVLVLSRCFFELSICIGFFVLELWHIFSFSSDKVVTQIASGSWANVGL